MRNSDDFRSITSLEDTDVCRKNDASHYAQTRILEELMLQVNETLQQKGIISQQIYKEAKVQIVSNLQFKKNS